jgi:hypothetical protein
MLRGRTHDVPLAPPAGLAPLRDRSPEGRPRPVGERSDRAQPSLRSLRKLGCVAIRVRGLRSLGRLSPLTPEPSPRRGALPKNHG